MATPVLAFGALVGVSWVQLQSDLVPVEIFFAWAVLPGVIGISTFWTARGLTTRAVTTRRWLIGVSVISAAITVGLLMAATATGVAKSRLAEWLSMSLDREVILLDVLIRDLPTRHDRGWRLEVDVHPAERSSSVEIPSRGILNWFDSRDHPVPEDLAPGQRWRLAARMRVPFGSLNPGGFDYEAWMLENRLFFSALVQTGPRVIQPYRLPDDTGVVSQIDRLRDRIRREIDRALPDHPSRQVLAALVVGDQRAISASDWAVFQRTGVAHLMSISGLHVTMFAALAGAIGGLIWRLLCRWPFSVAVWIPVQSVAAMTAILGAFGYALLAGFAVPAQRTAWMVAVFGLARMLGLRAGHWSVLSLALLVILIPDPMAVLAPGFWLSFLAVGFLFSLNDKTAVVIHQRRPNRYQRVWQTLKSACFSQLAITFGLLPITAYLFQQIVLVGLVANAVAIPVVSYLVTPLAMLGTFTWFIAESDDSLRFAATIQAWLHDVLTWMSEQSFAAIDWPSPGLWPTVVAALGMVAVFGRFAVTSTLSRFRYCGWFGLAFLWAGFPAAVAPGEMKVTVLDVGQGSSVLVRTRDHTLLYDAGPSFGTADAGSRIVLPTLRRFAVSTVDRLILSHLDQDHSGGVPTLVALSMVDAIQTPDPAAADALLKEKQVRITPSLIPCQAGDQWSWNGVQFRVLHPSSISGESNADSCVLRVEDAFGNSLMLTGDITARVERSIVAEFTRLFDPEDPLPAHLSGARLASQVVVAPHHGSRHALTETFLRAVSPSTVVIQAGFRHHYGHPHPETLARIQDTLGAGVTVLRTDLQGAIDLTWVSGRLIPQDFWKDHRRYWHRPREDLRAGTVSAY